MRRVFRTVMACVCVCLAGGCAGTVVPPPPPDARAGLERAGKLASRGKLPQARAAADAILRKHDRDWSVHLAVFRMWIQEERFREAGTVGLAIVDGRSRITLPRALTNREFAAIAVNASQALAASGRAKESERALDVAVRADPRSAEAANNLAYQLAEEERDLPKALRLAKIAVELAPKQGYIVDTLGWVYFKMGRMPEARHWLARAVELSPGDGELRAHLARAHLKAGELPGAYVEMEKALALAPYVPEVRSLRAAVIRRYNPPGPL